MRFLTYNIHHARGLDGRVSSRRVASVVRSAAPDVAGLQEVRRGRLLASRPAVFGASLGMRQTFQETMRQSGQAFGNLVLARGRLLSTERITLASGLEPRGCVVVRMELDGVRFAFATTHLGLDRDERARHLGLLAERLPRDLPLVLAGDFNGHAEELAPLAGLLTVAGPSPPTFPAGRPVHAIDLVALSEHWRLTSVRTLPSDASDHLPLVVELDLR
jgi:endonuclease/exonuclease/phosphatase family metal-dependent hydrolase